MYGEVMSPAVQSPLFIRVLGLHGFGYTRLRKIINITKIVRFDAEISYMQFSGVLKQNCIHTEKLFSFYTILGLHGAFRNVIPRITEKGLYNSAVHSLLISNLKNMGL